MEDMPSVIPQHERLVVYIVYIYIYIYMYSVYSAYSVSGCITIYSDVRVRYVDMVI